MRTLVKFVGIGALLASVVLFSLAVLDHSESVDLQLGIADASLARIAFGCLVLSAFALVVESVRRRPSGVRLPSVPAVFLLILGLVLSLAWSLDDIYAVLRERPIELQVGGTATLALAIIVMLRPARWIVLVATVLAFFLLKFGYVFALGVTLDKQTENCVAERMRKIHLIDEKEAAACPWAGGKSYAVVRDEFSDRVHARLSNLKLLDYAFVVPFPTRERLTLEVLQSIAREAKVAAGGSSAAPVVAGAADQDVRSVPQSQADAELRQAFESEPELFEAFADGANEHLSKLVTHFTLISIFMGNAFGIHLLVYVLLVYCMAEIYGTRRLAGLLEKTPGSSGGAGVAGVGVAGAGVEGAGVEASGVEASGTEGSPAADGTRGEDDATTTEAELHRFMSRTGRYERIHLARDSIPQLGFIGTVLGLSSAMTALGEADPVQVILRRPGISPDLASSLGLSFNTTFVALLSLVALGVYYSWLSYEGAYFREAVYRIRSGQTRPRHKAER